MDDGEMIPCAGVWKKASNVRCQSGSLPASRSTHEAALRQRVNVDGCISMSCFRSRKTHLKISAGELQLTWKA